MPYTLQKYIFKELVKVFALSTVAFTLMLSLGSILRPIQEFGASPVQVIKLLSCFLPVTLTFVLPVSAIFASALVYGRFASDNEFDACRASGISLLTLMYPGLFLAVSISICTLTLSFHVMPNFIHKAEKVVKADAKQICFRNIERKGFYTLPGGRFKIKADNVDSTNNLLSGVVIVEAKAGQIRKTIEADSANISMTAHEKYNELAIVAVNVFETDPDGEQIFSQKLPLSYRFSSLLADRIRFKKLSEIKEIRANPLEFYPIQKKVDQTYAQLAMELLSEDIGNAIGTRDSGKYYRLLQSQQKKLVFTADNCAVKDNGSIELTGNISFIEYDLDNREISQWQCNRAIIQTETELDINNLVMTLYDAAKKQDSGEVLLKFRPFFRGLKLPETITAKLGSDKLAAVEKLFDETIRADLLQRPSRKLLDLAEQVRKTTIKTLVEIDTEINSRLVFGIGCIALILTSVGLGVLYKGGHLLTAFAISMIPAAFLVICMMAGGNMAKNTGAGSEAMGISLMWTGFGILIVVMGLIYRKILRM